LQRKVVHYNSKYTPAKLGKFWSTGGFDFVVCK
jgi:hypothetical protein